MPSTPNSESYGNNQINRHRGAVSAARTGIEVDDRALNKVKLGIKSITDEITKLNKATKEWADNMERGSNASTGTSSSSYIKGVPSQGPPSPVKDTVTPDGKRTSNYTSTNQVQILGGGVRGLANQFGGPRFLGGMMVAGALGQGLGAMDARINRGAQYAASADRMSVMLQQQYGKTQQQVMAEMRQPLAQLRLGGLAGINDVLAYQSSIGGSMTSGSLQQFGQSVAGIRALSGYSKSTADVLQDQRALTDPTTVNRMQMMLGVSAFKYGGSMRDPMELRQSIVRSMGITGQSARAGLAPGSRLRTRLTDAGVPLEMQEEILRYAMQNDQFKAAGGRGMYDPTKESHRRRIGGDIEENFASQMEITDQKRTMREENFMARQIDNFEKMERHSQTMVEILSNIDSTLAGAYGVRASTGGWQRLGGRLLQGAGLALAVGSGGTLAGVGVGMLGLGTAMSGDPVDAGGVSGGVGVTPKSNASADSQITVPFGYGGKRISLTELKGKETFSRLDARMKDRLLAMMRENPNVGVGGGKRDPTEQERMFRDRYRPDPNGEVEWQGQRWKRVKGAAAAPPGRSMHEIGLAADLIGDLAWMNANAARFGLKHFANVNNEPWHVQPAELPNSRREFEAGGGGVVTEEATSADSQIGATPMATGGGSGSDVNEHAGWGPGLSILGQMSISDILEASRFMGGFSSGSGSRGGAGSGSIPSTSADLARQQLSMSGSGAELAARAAYAAGFRGEALFKIVAIAGRESGFRPDAINPNGQDTGLWQVNWRVWGETAKKELGIEKQTDLLDPMVNARAAWIISKGGTNWHGWKASSSSSHLGGRPGWDPNGNEMWNTENHQEAARNAIAALDASGASGDPLPQMPLGRGGNVSVSSPTYSITVAPTIKIEGNISSEQDLRRVARAVKDMVEQEMRTLELRGA